MSRSHAEFYSKYNISPVSRVEDWILDSIMKPLQDRRLLNILQVVACLNSKFDIHGSSPRFQSDWRCHKEVVVNNRGLNEICLDSCYHNNLNCLDYCCDFPLHTVALVRKLEELGWLSWDLVFDLELGKKLAWQDFFTLTQELSTSIGNLAHVIAEARREAASLLQSGHPNLGLKQSPQRWGRKAVCLSH